MAEQRPPTEELLPRLLAGRDQLARTEKEAILAGVLRGVGKKRRPERAWLLGLAGVAALGALVLTVLPEPDLVPRGGGGAGYALSCVSGGERVPCRQGSKLMFTLEPDAAAPYFAAFAERQDGTVIWYFPSESGTSLAATTGLLGTGIQLGAEHLPGTYRVFGLFSPRPLGRAEVRVEVDAGAALVERQLVVVE